MKGTLKIKAIPIENGVKLGTKCRLKNVSLADMTILVEGILDTLEIESKEQAYTITALAIAHKFGELDEDEDGEGEEEEE